MEDGTSGNQESITWAASLELDVENYYGRSLAGELTALLARILQFLRLSGSHAECS